MEQELLHFRELISVSVENYLKLPSVDIGLYSYFPENSKCWDGW